MSQHQQGPLDSTAPKPPSIFNGSTRHGLFGPRRLRHHAEVTLLTIGIIMTIIAYVGAIALLLDDMSDPAIVDDSRFPAPPTDIPEDEQELRSQFVLIMMLTPIVLWVARAMYYAQQRASAVRMSPTQFPEGYAMVIQAAQQLGLRRVPDAYVVSGSGVINAFAAGHGFRRYVVVHSDLFEIGGTVRDPQALRFVIGHEVGHIALGHTSWLRLVFTNLFRSVPILGSAYSRAQEYSADNCGYLYQPQGAPGVIGVLSAGKYLNANVNVFEMADRAVYEKGFWVHLVNWQSSHPILTWRAHALLKRNEPGRIFFRPKQAAYTNTMPPGSMFSKNWPTPDQAWQMLQVANAYRNPAVGEQFGRYPGVNYTGQLSAREVQTAIPLLSQQLPQVDNTN